MDKFKSLLKNTRDYLNYLENHYDNVQKAFDEFSRRIAHKNFNSKYNDFLFDTGLVDDYWFFVLRAMIIDHDLSKLGQEEFTQYRDNFYPISEEAKEKKLRYFNIAWEHHKKSNKHHWESRIESNNELPFRTYVDIHMSPLYAIENAMDWIAMAYQYNENPLNKYYLKNKDSIKLSENDKYIIETVYKIMMDKDLE